MTTIEFNETRACIEDALASASYAKHMMQIGDQYRRENNQDAANAALMMAWHIKGNISKVVSCMPMLTPEHAQLLDKPERQRLASALTKSSEELSQLIQEHHVTEKQLENYNDQEMKWYHSCLKIGHLAHLARNMAQRAERLPDNDEVTELMAHGVGKCYADAQESLEEVQQKQPPPSNAFPQTREQTKDLAISNYDELQTMDQQLTEKLTNLQAKANNSPGWCHICGDVIRANDAKAHTQTCIMYKAQRRYTVRKMDKRYARSMPIMIWVRSEQLQHWMILVVQPTTSLRQLDHFLRDQWLECCGHLSQFEIGQTTYSSCVPGPDDDPTFDNDLTEDNDQHMVHTVEETISHGQRFNYEFDYGDTTCLNLEHVAALPIPYHYVPEFINPPRQAEHYTEEFITVMARNRPTERCYTCRETAQWRYHENPYVEVPPEQGRPIVAPPYFCNACAPDDIALVALRNTPRSGVGCYDNTHDVPSKNANASGDQQHDQAEPKYVKPAGDPDQLAELLQLDYANHIIYWTAPHFEAAGEEIHELANLVSVNGNDLKSSLDAIERSILRWEDQSVDMLPSSWEQLTSPDDIKRHIICTLMEEQFEPIDELQDEHTNVQGNADHILAGIQEHCRLTTDETAEIIHEEMPASTAENLGQTNHLELDDRIMRIVDIAYQVMITGHSSLTGIAVHTMAKASGTTNAEPPAPDALVNATKTLAYAGAIARAAAKIIEFRIWPLVED